MHRAKFLSQSFVTSTLCLSCLRTNNELSLGELIYLKCIYFYKYFAPRFAPESHHTWIKLLKLTLFSGKVSWLVSKLAPVKLVGRTIDVMQILLVSMHHTHTHNRIRDECHVIRITLYDQYNSCNTPL